MHPTASRRTGLNVIACYFAYRAARAHILALGTCLRTPQNTPIKHHMLTFRQCQQKHTVFSLCIIHKEALVNGLVKSRGTRNDLNELTGNHSLTGAVEGQLQRVDHVAYGMRRYSSEIEEIVQKQKRR